MLMSTMATHPSVYRKSISPMERTRLVSGVP